MFLFFQTHIFDSFLFFIVGQGKRVCFREGTWAEKSEEGKSVIMGTTHRFTQDRMVTGQFSLHSRIESIIKATVANDRDIICFVYPSDAVDVNIRIATSLISAEQAKVNLDRELDPVRKYTILNVYIYLPRIFIIILL